ncbi:hypothetical protein [Kibdelosporangium aridum]|uniref:hypothetical protein n=1 Tax=Kibdelosporangium aridum TaxID=2030 RepID=UPI0035F038EA
MALRSGRAVVAVGALAVAVASGLAVAAVATAAALGLAVLGLGLVVGLLLVLAGTPLSRLPVVAVVVRPVWRALVVPRVWVAWAVWVPVGARVARTRSTSVRRTSLSLTPTACSAPMR